jgi:phosphoribosylamine--glycine ligase
VSWYAKKSMRILGIGDALDLGDMYLRLAASGHELRVHVADPAYHGVMAGMLERVDDWREQLGWIRKAGRDGLIVFETVGHGPLQDELRSDGFQVVGGSAFGDRLEGDRAFGQEVLGRFGLRTARTWTFRDHAAAIDFVAEHPGRYVYKPNGHGQPSTRTYVGVLEDGLDLVAVLSAQARRTPDGVNSNFVLMEHVSGVETGVGAYFDGERFLRPACLDWEHKRFFNGDLGELTGEMGTLVTYRGSERLFSEVLEPLETLLASQNHHGYVNVNTVINEDGVWPLEFTSRFGYPGFAILDALHTFGWEGILRAMLGSGDGGLATADGYALGVVLTIPPFPHLGSDRRAASDLPIFILGGMDAATERHLHFAEVAKRGADLVTSGASGYVLVATGTGEDAALAKKRAYELIARVVVPNARYRTDIGERFLRSDGERLRTLGYTGSGSSVNSALR